jgi:hypothetical protein
MAKLNDSHESSLRRLNDTHREKIALLDRQFLQQKQQLVCIALGLLVHHQYYPFKITRW